MKRATVDVAVFGGGAAGCAAAATAAMRGKSVLQVYRSLGATPLSSGMIDLLGRAPWMEGFVLKPMRELAALMEKASKHPYAIVGESSVRRGLKLALEALEPLGYEGSLEENTLLPNLIGTFKPTALYPSSFSLGSLSELTEHRAAVVGFKSLSWLNPESLAKLLSYSASRLGARASLDWRAVDFGSGGLAELAWQAEEKPLELASKLAELGYDVVGIPPVLGVREHRAVAEALAEEGVRFFEIASPPPSPPGLRLQIRLLEWARELGVQQVRGELAELEAEGKVRRCVVRVGGELVEVEAESYVLACGRFIGGGAWIRGFSVISELKYAPRMLPSSRHAALCYGVEVDELLHPKARGVAVEEAYVAGSMLGGYSYSSELSGLGVAFSTGWAAGQLASGGSIEG